MPPGGERGRAGAAAGGRTKGPERGRAGHRAERGETAAEGFSPQLSQLNGAEKPVRVRGNSLSAAINPGGPGRAALPAGPGEGADGGAGAGSAALPGGGSARRALPEGHPVAPGPRERSRGPARPLASEQCRLLAPAPTPAPPPAPAPAPTPVPVPGEGPDALRPGGAKGDHFGEGGEEEKQEEGGKEGTPVFLRESLRDTRF